MGDLPHRAEAVDCGSLPAMTSRPQPPHDDEPGEPEEDPSGEPSQGGSEQSAERWEPL